MTNQEVLFSALITEAPIAAVVRIAGNDEDLRLRVGTVSFVDAEKGYATLKVEKGFRSVRFRDVLLTHRL